MARASQFAVSAARMALEDSGVNISKNKKIGAIIGTTMADIQSLEEIDKYWTQKGEDDVWSINVIKYPGNGLSDHIAFFFGLEGLNNVIPTACSAGNYSIGYAYDLIRQGKYDVICAGGADPMSRITFTGFGRLFAMAPEKCQPFDKNRKGMIVGEGAGVLIIEEYEHAVKRNANIYAEIMGYGLSCDAYHMTAPRVEGVVKVMEKAIIHSGIKKDDVDYVCAHGTGTPANDKTECDAMRKVFGESIDKLSISSIKSMLGHTMGAASAIEAISCVLSLVNNIIPPTINNETPDPDFDGLDIVLNKPKDKELNIVLNNSLAFGGNNACLVLKDSIS